MKKTILMFAFALSMLSVTSCKSETKTESTSDKASETAKAEVTYACPMDCEKGKTYTEKGKCPVCEMDLIASTDETMQKQDGHEHEDHEGHSH